MRSETPEEIRDHVLKWPWGMSIEVTMKDGTRTRGYLHERNRYSFQLREDEGERISYRNVRSVGLPL